MVESPTTARIVITGTSSPHEARSIARHLLEEKLAACISILPRVESLYHWQGGIESAEESLLLIKTTAEKLAQLEARLLALHSYETPEFLSLAVPEANNSYLQWLVNSLHQ